MLGLRFRDLHHLGPPCIPASLTGFYTLDKLGYLFSVLLQLNPFKTLVKSIFLHEAFFDCCSPEFLEVDSHHWRQNHMKCLEGRGLKC